MTNLTRSELSRKKAHVQALRFEFGFIGEFAELERLERYAHAFAEKCCNEDVSNIEQSKFEREVNKRIGAMFSDLPETFFVNGDPRGYALKVEDESRSYSDDLIRDWGNYIILVPEEF